MDSWSRIVNATSEIHLMDAGLKGNDAELLSSKGICIHAREEQTILSRLEPFPVLRQIRERFVTWRKIVDPSCLFPDDRQVLLIDTDVYIPGPVQLPTEDAYDFIYQCDDVPAYRGAWSLPFREPMVYALNAGFIQFRPSAIDLEHLEWLANQYFIRAKKYWWTVQAAWSVVVARSKRRAIFDGEDVRVLSGSEKRTPEQIKQNVIKIFATRKSVTDDARIREYLEGGAVLHFAGAGKRWFEFAAEATWKDPRRLRALPVPNATAIQRLIIAARMMIK